MRARSILLIGALGALVYSFPGYTNFDAALQLDQARRGVYSDWHPPFMARYWGVLDAIVHGPALMLILQIALFVWGAYALLARRFAPRVAAMLAVGLVWFPPVLAPMGVVWKDAQMAGFLLAGVALLTRESGRSRLGGIALLVCAAAVRDNAVIALPPFVALAVWTWGVRGFVRILAVSLVVSCGIAGSAIAIDRHYTDVEMHAWSRANAIHDITGMICLGDKMSDDDVRDELRGVALRKTNDLQAWFCKQYSPRWWLQLSSEDGLFDPEPTDAERAARRDAYFRLLRDRTGAFVEHRWNVTKELLGLTSDGAEEPVCQSYGTDGQIEHLRLSSQSYVQHKLGVKFHWLARTLLFRPWAYLLLGLVFLGYAIYRRDGLVIATITSGLLYEASFIVGAAGPAYRYSHWMVTCTCLATLFVIRLRARA